MDGHHQLIRWKMVIHGMIDGFSRYIVFLWCSNNNRADTVTALFKDAAISNDPAVFKPFPAMVCADDGGENVGVAAIVQAKRGKGKLIIGKSVHNQRIERLWVDVWKNVSGPRVPTFARDGRWWPDRLSQRPTPMVCASGLHANRQQLTCKLCRRMALAHALHDEQDTETHVLCAAEHGRRGRSLSSAVQADLDAYRRGDWRIEDENVAAAPAEKKRVEVISVHDLYGDLEADDKQAAAMYPWPTGAARCIGTDRGTACDTRNKCTCG